jgi:hypothetical protein
VLPPPHRAGYEGYPPSFRELPILGNRASDIRVSRKLAASDILLSRKLRGIKREPGLVQTPALLSTLPWLYGANCGWVQLTSLPLGRKHLVSRGVPLA